MHVSVAPSKKLRPLLPIATGGLVAGALDIALAFCKFGWGVPRGIASGLLGTRAYQGGTWVWILGLALHFLIAFTAAGIYYAASTKLDLLRRHFLLCGAFYGIAVYLVMNLIVLPLSAVPWPIGPFPLRTLIQGLLVHVFLIGLPISFSTWRFSE